VNPRRVAALKEEITMLQLQVKELEIRIANQFENFRHLAGIEEGDERVQSDSQLVG
jgi:hypothetical protein